MRCDCVDGGDGTRGCDLGGVLRGDIPAGSFAAVDSHGGEVGLVEGWPEHFDEFGGLGAGRLHRRIGCGAVVCVNRSSLERKGEKTD